MIGVPQGCSYSILSSLQIDASTSLIEYGQHCFFRIRGFDQDGKAMTLQNVQWEAEGGSIDRNGNFVAGEREGNFTVTASVGQIRGRTSIQVIEPPRLNRLIVESRSSASVSLMFGESCQFQVRGFDQRGNSFQVNSVTWEAEGGSIDNDGNFVAGEREGNFTVTASVGQIRGRTSIQVIEPARLTRIEINPSEVITLKPKESQKFQVTGFDQ